MTTNNKKLGTIMMKNGIHIIKDNKVKDIKINTLTGKNILWNPNNFLPLNPDELLRKNTYKNIFIP